MKPSQVVVAQTLIAEQGIKMKLNEEDSLSDLVADLLTVRPPKPLADHIYAAIDDMLQTEMNSKTLTSHDSIPAITDEFVPSSYPCAEVCSLWRGDITSLKIDCIVNAANSDLLGCFQVGHKCIDNVIHHAAGPKLRLECNTLRANHRRKPIAMVTRGYQLPSTHVIHTVGPICHDGIATKEKCLDLAHSYMACLDAAAKINANSIAFCCISAGVFGFPAKAACRIALSSVAQWLQTHNNSTIKHVVFNVFAEKDHDIYKEFLVSSDAIVPLEEHIRDILPGPSAISTDVMKEWIDEADCLLIAAGAGLSIAAGLDYSDHSIMKQHFRPLYDQGYHNFYAMWGFQGNPQLLWGYLSQQVSMARFNWPHTPVYSNLLKLVAKKDYFVYTSNADGMFVQNGFEKNKVYTVQGDYSMLQCMKPCSQESFWPSKPIIDELLKHTDNETCMVNDKQLLPVCPRCKGNVFLNVRAADWFLETPQKEQRARFQQFLDRNKHKKLVILELGAGFNTPSVIRLPMEYIVKNHSQTNMIRVNPEFPEVPSSIKKRSLEVRANADIIVRDLVS